MPEWAAYKGLRSLVAAPAELKNEKAIPRQNRRSMGRMSLFAAQAARWHDGGIGVAAVIGHALMEQALVPGRRLVGRCVAVQGTDDAACVARVAGAIAAGEILGDPLQLRPLPLAGVPGWQPRQDDAFYAEAGYFRPLREGRTYPGPLR